MAVLSGFPQNVTYQSVTVAQGGGSENLLINPRGRINQANEPDGVLAPYQYFCDGWKAGPSGAEVYRDSDGFRLISGSILQLVPNNLEVGRAIRGNMDVLNGSPVISINSGSDNEQSNTDEYIQFEVSGNNSKFTRLICAESIELPIYQQVSDELSPCYQFMKLVMSGGNPAYSTLRNLGGLKHISIFFNAMHKTPSAMADFSLGISADSTEITIDRVRYLWGNSHSENAVGVRKIVLDARP